MEEPEMASTSKGKTCFSHGVPLVQHGHSSWGTNGPKRRGFKRGSASLQHDCCQGNLWRELINGETTFIFGRNLSSFEETEFNSSEFLVRLTRSEAFGF